MKSSPAPPPPSSSKPVLAIDFDDTITFNAQLVIDAYNRLHDARVSMNDVYVAGKLGNPDHGWRHDPEQAIAWVRDYLLSEEGQSYPPAPGAEEALGKLRDHYELIVVTGRSQDWSSGTQPWLERFLPGVFSAVHYAGDRPKSRVWQDLDVKAIIDDNQRDLGGCRQPDVIRVLFGYYPWNADADLTGGVIRANNWAEVEEILLGTTAG